jgi:DNA adenine methylase
MKTPISYYGGKQTMLKHIKPLVPIHKVYTESFAGGAALYWAKEPSEIEVINDVNRNVINFYRVIKTKYHELKCRIDATLHSREEHDFAGIIYDYPQFFTDVDIAWAVWVRSKMGFASKLDGSWGYDKTRNTMSKKITNAKSSFTEELAKRLERTQIECTNALRIIKSRDTEETFHFVDPPYVNSDCGHYTNTFNIEDFRQLLDLLSNIKGKFMLTMYPHELLDKFIFSNNWKVVTVERTISVSRTTRRKQSEIIVMNY